MAKAYPLNARPSKVTVIERAPGRVIVRLEELHYFIDSHHVGAFEGAMKYAGAEGRVLVAPRGKASADLLLEWRKGARRPGQGSRSAEGPARVLFPPVRALHQVPLDLLPPEDV